ncbi:sodium-dependent bicarbonate transport family permease [Niveibacterium sp. 24ML]|uniref:sodium-dependent bicarbonate transport family permease n=1 Tax=Niveibacterium sp. 24ML TaxID=2985512 RepID=UPI00226F021D|nr:sodium-dependent bicarbonate transport family permease [Niveibacterium sp. 24ML]MCX9155806.1 sodium-dependent bicarbonate transport family permease [Niveibacterium sp. 24ML]
MSALQNLLDPAILFFVFGIIAGALRSNLEIPPAIAKFLSLYLLMSVGLKGGFALAKSGLGPDVLIALGAALLLALVIPAIGYMLLARLVSRYDAAAIAATYGSVSAVTFIAATQFLSRNDIDFGGHMAVALTLMETPAIIMAVALAAHVRRVEGKADASAHAHTPGGLLREALTDGNQMLLLGSLAIGVLTGESGKAVMEPFSGNLFKGMLALFLMDMGLTVARNLGGLRGTSPLLIAYGLLSPLAHAGLAIGLAALLGLPAGDAILLAVLAASASYIVVPAVVREAIPEARPGLYFGMALGLTFPFNILIGIPLYTAVVNRVWT